MSSVTAVFGETSNTFQTYETFHLTFRRIFGMESLMELNDQKKGNTPVLANTQCTSQTWKAKHLVLPEPSNLSPVKARGAQENSQGVDRVPIIRTK